MGNRTAFVIPCFNEELTIAQVVADCRRAHPQASIYVFDNNSTDATADRARAAGAQVIRSTRQGKGQVIRHAFEILNEEALVVLDGDGTYPASLAPKMFQSVLEDRYDMVVCNRRDRDATAYPKFHRFGNRVFSWFVGFLLGRKVSDVFSGYRCVSREFYKSLDLESRGFEVESELTLKAVSHDFPVLEIEGPYDSRPRGSVSKLRTFHDGFRILKFISLAVRDCQPFKFFGSASFLCFVLSLWSGSAPVMDFVREHYVHTLPRAVLAASLMILSLLFLAVGLILDVQIRSLRTQSKLMRRWMWPRDSQGLSSDQRKAS